jgi:hypothetical protein
MILPVGAYVVFASNGNDGPVRTKTGIVTSNAHAEWLGPGSGFYDIDCYNGEKIQASVICVTCDHVYSRGFCKACGWMQGRAEPATAANRLEAAGLAADIAERAWSTALAELSDAVHAAQHAGIPKGDVPGLVAVRLPLGLSGGTSEKLRPMIRRAYWSE